MADYILDKGFPALATYNSSAAAGVTKFRFVKTSISNSITYIDLATSATNVGNIGVVQENADAVKVATGKVVLGVRLLGVSYVYANATPGAIAIGTRVTCGAAGGAILAATGNFVHGICIGMSVPGGTVAAGDLISVLLTPGYIAAP